MTLKDAIKIIYEKTPLDIIYEQFETPDFFEFHGSAGGDSLTYRVDKKTKNICEK